MKIKKDGALVSLGGKKANMTFFDSSSSRWMGKGKEERWGGGWFLGRGDVRVRLGGK